MECPICFMNYQVDLPRGIPRLLQCGHTFCTSCLQKVINARYQPTIIFCPFCREPHNLTSPYAESLSKNYFATEVISQMQMQMQRQQEDLFPPQYWYQQSQRYPQKNIQLISGDNIIFSVAPNVAVLSDAVSFRIEDDSTIDTFRFPKLSGELLDRVIQFMHHFRQEPYQEIGQALSTEQSWYYQFLRGDPNYPFGDEFLQQLVFAADDMEVNPLLELSKGVLGSKEPGRYYDHPIFISQEYY